LIEIFGNVDPHQYLNPVKPDFKNSESKTQRAVRDVY
jgi:hypothetical protein